VARIHAIVRRSKGHAQSVVQTGDLVVNLDTKTVEVNGARVHTTGKEYQMLELLSLRKGTTLTKEMFLNHLYGGMDEPEMKIIDVFICKLRKKLANAADGRDYIETVWGRGYVLREPEDGARAAGGDAGPGVRESQGLDHNHFLRLTANSGASDRRPQFQSSFLSAPTLSNLSLAHRPHSIAAAQQQILRGARGSAAINSQKIRCDCHACGFSDRLAARG
jgi:DNA-binding winged helix-turn-helix (wHTH) protein